MSSSKPRGPVWFLVRVAVFLLVFGMVAEVWFRTVMPASETPFSYQREPATMYRFDPRQSTTGLFTYGRLCRPGGEWRVNDAGWNSAVEYVSTDERQEPMIALLGDSFIEGHYTDVDEHVDSYLPGMLPGTVSYAFGISGWYLEQYVAASRYAEERFQPEVLVIFLGVADVSDSVRENGMPSPYWWQIGARGESFEELPPEDAYTLSPKLALAKKSALFRYLRYNAKLSLPGQGDAVVAQPETEAEAATQDDAASTEAPAEDEWRSLLKAADFMVERLCTQHPGTPVVFAVKGDRYLRTEDIASIPLSAEGRAVRAACAGRPQCSLLDLRYAFSRDWATNGIEFEAADGAHWNAHANLVVARAIADHIRRNGLL